jgi:hypothetical protein
MTAVADPTKLTTTIDSFLAGFRDLENDPAGDMKLAMIRLRFGDNEHPVSRLVVAVANECSNRHQSVKEEFLKG